MSLVAAALAALADLGVIAAFSGVAAAAAAVCAWLAGHDTARSSSRDQAARAEIDILRTICGATS